MPAPSGSVKVATRDAWPALLVAAVGVWLLRGYLWPVLGNVEVDALRAMLDPRLFHRDFAVQEALHFSPRFYYNQLVLLPARAGIPLAWVFAGGHVVALTLLLGGLRRLMQSTGLGDAAGAVLVLWLLVAGPGTLGGTYFYTHAPVPAVWAMAGVAWGAALAWRGAWTRAFACFGAAALVQFLVGFYGGALAAGALVATQGARRWPSLLPWAGALALVYVPMLATGGTGSGALGDGEFVEIYARLRLPHHLVPSTWGAAAWLEAIAFYAGAGFLFWRTPAGRPAHELRWYGALVAATAAALAANHVFVEIHPIALVAKLQPARLTAPTQAITLLLLASRVQARVARRDWWGASLFALIPFAPAAGALLFLAAILLSDRVPARARQPARWGLVAAVVLALQPWGAKVDARAVQGGLALLGFASLLLVFRFEQRRVLMSGLAVAALGLGGAAALASTSSRWPAALAGHFAIDARPWSIPGFLGWRFGRQSHPDALVLVPPAYDSWAFKLYAQRGVVVDDKSMPFTDRGMREWKERMERVLGVPLTPRTDLDAAWRARSPAELAATAGRYGARYVLTLDSCHPTLPGVRIDQAAGWSLWQLPAAAPR